MHMKYTLFVAGAGSPTGGTQFQNPDFENRSFLWLEQAPLLGEHNFIIPIKKSPLEFRRLYFESRRAWYLYKDISWEVPDER